MLFGKASFRLISFILLFGNSFHITKYICGITSKQAISQMSFKASLPIEQRKLLLQFCNET